MREPADVAVVGTGVVGLAVAVELLHRGLDVTVVGPRTGAHREQGTRAAGAMLSTFSELEPQHDAARAGMETAERLAAHQAYPAWLERIEAKGGGTVQAPSGTWVFAPAGRRSCLDPIAAAARAAGHSVEEHDASSVPALRAPASSAGALWPPTEARGVDVAVWRGHRADGPAGSVPTFTMVVASWHLLFGNRVRGCGEMAAALVISALALGALASPPQLLLSKDTGAVGTARALAVETAALVLDKEAIDTSRPTTDNAWEKKPSGTTVGAQVRSSPSALSRPLRDRPGRISHDRHAEGCPGRVRAPGSGGVRARGADSVRRRRRERRGRA